MLELGFGFWGSWGFFFFLGSFCVHCTLLLLLGVFLWLLLPITEDELFTFSSCSSSSSPLRSKRVAATTLTCYSCYKCHDSFFLPPRHQPPSAGALVVNIERLLTLVLVCVCLGKPEKETTNERKKERKKEEEREREREREGGRDRQREFGALVLVL